jgi:DNA primase
MYKSPFRKDKIPSFNIYPSENGYDLFYKDFGHSSGDSIVFVSNLYSISYTEALQKIYNDLILTHPLTKLAA